MREMPSGYWTRREDVGIGTDALPGILALPDRPRGLVIFVHGSGSNRHSRRNVHVAAELHARRFATLLFDLLSEADAASRGEAFDIELLTSRVLDAVRWSRADRRTRALPIGLFGASTGAAAALAAAAERPDDISAVVSRGGRPDLTGRELGHVRAPTLLIVGGADAEVLALNEAALHRLTCLKQLDVIPRASYLFEEEGALDAVVRAASHWFDLYLVPKSAVAASAAGKRTAP
jgi:putative phosphoribosyl transferase